MTKRQLFRWQATDDSGKLFQGYQFANSREQVLGLLTAAGQLPLKVYAGRDYRSSHWREIHKIAFVRQLATLLKAGMPLTGSLQLLAQDHPDPGWQALLNSLQQHIASGFPFSQALGMWPDIFPPLYAALIHTGELTGTLDECCLRLARQQEQQRQLRLKVKKALRYPLLVLAVALVVSIGLMLVVLPEFVAIYQTFDAPLPLFTRAIIALSQQLQHLAPVLLLLLFFAALFRRRQSQKSQNWQRREQQLLLALPALAALYRGSQLSQIYTTLSLTQHSGLTLLQSLQAAENTLDHLLWREALCELQRHIAAGNPLCQIIRSHPLFTPLCYQLIKVGEESGSLDLMLARLADWHQTQTHQRADNLAATLEPLMMVITGLIVGTLVIAMYLPVFRLGDTLS